LLITTFYFFSRVQKKEGLVLKKKKFPLKKKDGLERLKKNERKKRSKSKKKIV